MQDSVTDMVVSNIEAQTCRISFKNLKFLMCNNRLCLENTFSHQVISS